MRSCRNRKRSLDAFVPQGSEVKCQKLKGTEEGSGGKTLIQGISSDSGIRNLNFFSSFILKLNNMLKVG